MTFIGSMNFVSHLTSCLRHCVNIVSMLVPNIGQWRSHNIAWMLSQRGSPMMKTTLPQHCLNVVSTSVPVLSQCWSPTFGTDIHTTFTQHCLNIVLTSVPNVESDNVHKMLHEGCLNVGWCWPTLCQHWDIGRNTILVQCSHVWTSTQCCSDV